jgi:hypothetical protein
MFLSSGRNHHVETLRSVCLLFPLFALSVSLDRNVALFEKFLSRAKIATFLSLQIDTMTPKFHSVQSFDNENRPLLDSPQHGGHATCVALSLVFFNLSSFNALTHFKCCRNIFQFRQSIHRRWIVCSAMGDHEGDLVLSYALHHPLMKVVLSCLVLRPPPPSHEGGLVLSYALHHPLHRSNLYLSFTTLQRLPAISWRRVALSLAPSHSCSSASSVSTPCVSCWSANIRYCAPSRHLICLDTFSIV